MDKEKLCPTCEATIIGRSDKKFCSMKCKSIGQYEKRQKNEGFFLKIEKQLRINRKLLKKFNRSGFATIKKGELISAGFNPKFFTHFWKNAKGKCTYLFMNMVF